MGRVTEARQGFLGCHPMKFALNPIEVDEHPAKVDGPQLSPHLHPTKMDKRRKSSDQEETRILLDRTKIGSYLFSFHAYLIQLGKRQTELGSYLFWFGAYLFSSDQEEKELGSYLFSSDKGETKLGCY